MYVVPWHIRDHLLSGECKEVLDIKLNYGVNTHNEWRCLKLKSNTGTVYTAHDFGAV